MTSVGRAIVIIFIGGLGSLLVASWLPMNDFNSYLVQCAGMILSAVLAARVLGHGSLRDSFGHAPGPTGFAWAIGVAGFTLLVANLYVYALVALLGEGDDTPEDPESLFLGLVFAAVLAPLVEEFSDRGVLWIALRQIVSRNLTIVCTAAVFAFMHGLNGGFVLELPHRFVMGLALGWLRERSGSLWPCVLAHALHNSVCVCWG